MKFTALFLTITTGAFLTISAASAADTTKGMALFKKDCKGCHISGKDGGPLTPISKTKAQWLRYFDKNRHKENPAAWSTIPEDELQVIRQWLHDHAADSSQPETCG